MFDTNLSWIVERLSYWRHRRHLAVDNGTEREKGGKLFENSKGLRNRREERAKRVGPLVVRVVGVDLFGGRRRRERGQRAALSRAPHVLLVVECLVGVVRPLGHQLLADVLGQF